LTVPVVVEGRVAFVLAVASLRKAAAWRESQVPGLRVLAEALATASQRCDAEEDLRLTQYAVDRNPAMILRIDMEGRFVYANEAACNQLGYALAEMRRMHIWDISGTTTAEMWPMRAMQIREQGSASFESTYQRRDGTFLPVEIRTIHLRNSVGEFFFTFAFDIRIRKAAQEAAHQHLKRMQALAKELTHAEERQRRELAAILHDDVGQNLFAATTQLLAMRNGSNGTLPTIEKVLSLLDQVTRDTRELTFELCPPVLYQIGLAPALQRLTDQFAARHHITCTLEGSGDGPADLNIRGLAYQAARELLNNAVRHGHAKHIVVRLSESQDTMTMEVHDDGRGFDPLALRAHADGPGGFGLFHLRERLELMGGNLLLHAAPGRGTRVEVLLPLKSPLTADPKTEAEA
jgi:PAS domain S-box-containing protein